MKRVPLAALLLATFAVAGLALALPLIAAFSGLSGPTPNMGEPVRARQGGRRTPIGEATMQPDGTIVLSLHQTADNPPLHAEARLEYPPTHPQYRYILDHLGRLEPGQNVVVLAFPD